MSSYEFLHNCHNCSVVVSDILPHSTNVLMNSFLHALCKQYILKTVFVVEYGQDRSTWKSAATILILQDLTQWCCKVLHPFVENTFSICDHDVGSAGCKAERDSRSRTILWQLLNVWAGGLRNMQQGDARPYPAHIWISQLHVDWTLQEQRSIHLQQDTQTLRRKAFAQLSFAAENLLLQNFNKVWCRNLIHILNFWVCVDATWAC